MEPPECANTAPLECKGAIDLPGTMGFGIPGFHRAVRVTQIGGLPHLLQSPPGRTIWSGVPLDTGLNRSQYVL